MDCISDILARANLQQIREFILYGSESLDVSKKDYLQRLTEAREAAIVAIDEKVSDPAAADALTELMFAYASSVGDVYMEIGMQCGASLSSQLLSKNGYATESKP